MSFLHYRIVLLFVARGGDRDTDHDRNASLCATTQMRSNYTTRIATAAAAVVIATKLVSCP
jgi:hypothetical protein